METQQTEHNECKVFTTTVSLMIVVEAHDVAEANAIVDNWVEDHGHLETRGVLLWDDVQWNDPTEINVAVTL